MGGGRRKEITVKVPVPDDGDLGIKVNDDLVVERVQDQGAGVAVGDELLKVNGVRVGTAGEYRRELERAVSERRGRALTVSVRRRLEGAAPGGGGEDQAPLLEGQDKHEPWQRLSKKLKKHLRGGSGGEESQQPAPGQEDERTPWLRGLRRRLAKRFCGGSGGEERERYSEGEVRERIKEIVEGVENPNLNTKPGHVRHGVVVKFQRSRFWVAVLCFMALVAIGIAQQGSATVACVVVGVTVLATGVYLFLRPSRETAVLVLTEGGRVILEKNRHQLFEGSGRGGVMAKAMVILGLLLLLSLLPVALVYLCADVVAHSLAPFRDAGTRIQNGATHAAAVSAGAIEGAAGREIFLEAPEQRGEDVTSRGIWGHHALAAGAEIFLEAPEQRGEGGASEGGIWGHHALVYYVVIAVLWVAFMLWVWVNRDQDFGTRYHREYKAENIAAIQYTQEEYHSWCCCWRRRRGSLRLFFGKYPDPAELSARMPSSVPSAGAVVPSASKVSAAPPAEGDVEQRAAWVLPWLEGLLAVTAVLVQLFTLYGWSQEFWAVWEAHDFCHTARLPQMCTEDHCKWYAVQQDLGSYQYCEHVQWRTVQDWSDNWDCEATFDGGECCVGCTMGQFLASVGYGDAGVWMEHVDDAANNFALALAFASAAITMGALLGNVKETPELDVAFVQDFNQPDSTRYSMTEELMLKFMRDTFQKAGRAEDKVEWPGMWVEEDPDDDADELKEGFAEHNVAGGSLTKERNWYEFFQGGQLVELRSSCPPWQKPWQASIRLPIRCLGFMEKEKVLAAWAELPHMGAPVAISIVLGALLGMVIAIYLPEFMGGPVVDTDWCSRDQEYLCDIARPLLVVAGAAAIAWALLSLEFLRRCWLNQCVVILTEERVFAVCCNFSFLRKFCCRRCTVPMSLRVEAFRHNDKVFYGQMRTATQNCWNRCLKRSPGEVNMQCQFGSLSLHRRFGNVVPIYHVVATVLADDVPDVDFKGILRKKLGEDGIQQRDLDFVLHRGEGILNDLSDIRCELAGIITEELKGEGISNGGGCAQEPLEKVRGELGDKDQREGHLLNSLRTVRESLRPVREKLRPVWEKLQGGVVRGGPPKGDKEDLLGTLKLIRKTIKAELEGKPNVGKVTTDKDILQILGAELKVEDALKPVKTKLGDEVAALKTVWAELGKTSAVDISNRDALKTFREELGKPQETKLGVEAAADILYSGFEDVQGALETAKEELGERLGSENREKLEKIEERLAKLMVTPPRPPFMDYGVEADSWEPYEGEATSRNAPAIEWRAETGRKQHTYLARAEEVLMFVWSFKEAGLLVNPCDTHNHVVLTSDRIRLISQEEPKDFDCRTWLCWGAFQPCRWLRCCCCCCCRLPRRRIMRSFLNYTHLEAFSTETSVQPSLLPCECPCYVKFCDALTSCFSCSWNTCPGVCDYFKCPAGAEPRRQIWLKWMQKYAKSLNPDLTLSVRPYAVDEAEDKYPNEESEESRDAGAGAGDEGKTCWQKIRAWTCWQKCGLGPPAKDSEAPRALPHDKFEVQHLRDFMEEVLSQRKDKTPGSEEKVSDSDDERKAKPPAGQPAGARGQPKKALPTSARASRQPGSRRL